MQIFLKTYFGSDDIPETQEQILENKEGTIKFTSRWLLHQLNLHLNAHMNHVCVNNKFGILLYKRGGELLTTSSGHWGLVLQKIQITLQGS